MTHQYKEIQAKLIRKQSKYCNASTQNDRLVTLCLLSLNFQKTKPWDERFSNVWSWPNLYLLIALNLHIQKVATVTTHPP